MIVTVASRRVSLQIVPLAMTLLICVLSYLYYDSVKNTPMGGEESITFIKPMMLLLCLCGIFVLPSTIRFVDEKCAADGEETTDISAIRRKAIFVSSLVILAVSIEFLGFVIPSCVFIVLLTRLLGTSSHKTLLYMIFLTFIFIRVVYAGILNVPLPLWPPL